MNVRILVVDDEKNILALFKKMLTPEAFRTMDNSYERIEVETLPSGEEAWTLIQSSHFDLIISDLAMEGMNGIELLERVKSFKPDIPFMILTGVGTIEDAVRSMKLGAYDYLTKPFQHDELLLSICKALDYGRLHIEVKTLRQRLNHNGTVEASKIFTADFINDLISRNRSGNVEELERIIKNALALMQNGRKDSEKTTNVSKNKKTSGTALQSEDAFSFSEDQISAIEGFLRNRLNLKTISDTVVGKVEKMVIRKALTEVGDNKAEAARRLGISRPALYKKLKDYNLE